MTQNELNVPTLQTPSRTSIAPRKKSGVEINRVCNDDRPFHEWYRFVLSYPPHLIQDYAERFGLMQKSSILDPFCGTGTTLVESKKLGIRSFGIEAHPMTAFASRKSNRSHQRSKDDVSNLEKPVDLSEIIIAWFVTTLVAWHDI